MDALEYMFSVAREDSSNVLEFKPECIMREDLMSLSSKFPLIPGSQRSITFCTTPLSQKVSFYMKRGEEGNCKVYFIYLREKRARNTPRKGL